VQPVPFARLQSGASRKLFERWCGDARNTVLIAGYSVAGTLGYEIKDQPQSVRAEDGR
jgi:cleavage and polyadenylation specificity factor subunit 3